MGRTKLSSVAEMRRGEKERRRRKKMKDWEVIVVDRRLGE